MSARSKIVLALVAKLNSTLDGTAGTVNLFDSAHPFLKYWDEINSFPAVYVVAGSESREYLPSSFKWGYLNISLKVYVKGETPDVLLENLLEDIERVIDANRQLAYDVTVPAAVTTEINITSIVTDEGLLAPYGIGEVNLQVRYQVLN